MIENVYFPNLDIHSFNLHLYSFNYFREDASQTNLIKIFFCFASVFKEEKYKKVIVTNGVIW